MRTMRKAVFDTFQSKKRPSAQWQNVNELTLLRVIMVMIMITSSEVTKSAHHAHRNAVLSIVIESKAAAEENQIH